MNKTTHTHFQSKLTFHLFWKKIKKLLNEARLLDLEIENLKDLLARAAAAVPQAAAGSLLRGDKRPPMPLPAQGDPAG